MEYRQLGNSDLEVSLVCLGTMTFGEQNTEAEAFQQLDWATAQGVNFIDVAEMYPVPPKPETYGDSERMVGNWLRARGARDKVVLATKVAGRGDRNAGMEHVRGGARLTPEQVHAAVDASLARLQTDYIDLYQVHWPERLTNFFGRLGYSHSDDDGVPIVETLQALGELVQAGKVRHIGVSNETPWGLMEYCRLAEAHDLPRIASIQNPYNLLNRSFEVGLAEISIREQISCLAYSPLAFGALSGKYRHGQKPAGARLTRYERFARYTNPQALAAIDVYCELAEAHQLSPAQLALAFTYQRDFMSSVIIGATSLEQLQENVAAAAVTLSPEVLAELETVHQQYCIPSP